MFIVKGYMSEETMDKVMPNKLTRTLLQFQITTYSKHKPLPRCVRTRRLLAGISVSLYAVLKLSKGKKIFKKS